MIDLVLCLVVAPAKAGVQDGRREPDALGSRFRGNDDKNIDLAGFSGRLVREE